jgi:adenosine deaminase
MGLTELHSHLGGGVPMRIMHQIACEQGIRLPVKDYFEFVRYLSAGPQDVSNLDQYLTKIHLCDKIQSSAMAVEWSTYHMVSDCYRNSNVTKLEIRANLAKRNNNSELDLDRIILAALHGIEKATLEFRTSAGLIFCLAREFPIELNEILVDKAIKYKNRGVIGIDLAGKETFRIEDNIEPMARLYGKAKSAGLHTTIHVGESSITGPQGMLDVIYNIRPDRIGHGVQALHDNAVCEALAGNCITLELCPTSNMRTGAIKDVDQYKHLINKLNNFGVRYTINTDATQMLHITLQHEINWMINNQIMTLADVEWAKKCAVEASFL